MATKFKSILCCACLLGALATSVVWVRSHYVSDSFRWNVSAPPPAPAPASASSGTSEALFLLLKRGDIPNPYRSVKTVPGALVVQQHLPFEVFV